MSQITVIGDSMLDKYIYGNTDRKNPESPMPLLSVEKEEYRLGGASNVANNIVSLNGGANLISVIGNDFNGDNFKQLCQQYKINLIPILSDKPTITKMRFIDSQYKQQLLRVDYEEKILIKDSDIEDIIKTLIIEKPKFIIISDYNKGIINQYLTDSLKKFSEETGTKILVDAKPQNLALFNGVYLIKPNFKEFCEMIGKKIDNTDDNIASFGKEFTKKYSTNLVVTRGSKGSSLITKDGNIFHIQPSEERKVFDVTGAGDTFIATIAYALDHGYTLEDSVKLANKASGIVVEKVGTATITKEELGIL
ncbi:MAG: PfkB family carbohydrate kinase [Candidatus Absconditicoccaceae bacterium]